MKKLSRYLSILLPCFMLLSFSGCTAASNSDAGDSASSNNALAIFHYYVEQPYDSYSMDAENAEDEVLMSKDDHTLTLLDEEHATYTLVSEVGSDRKSSFSYNGSYEYKNNNIIFHYMGQDYQTDTIFYLDGNTVTHVDYYYGSDFADLAGLYTGFSEDYGDLILDIDESGQATLNMGERSLYGTIYYYDNQLDLMVADDVENIDWYVTLEGSTFSYTPYRTALYQDYAGIQTINGDLGSIEFVFDTEGGVTAQITIDGVETEFAGDFYIDDEEKCILSANLTSADGLITLDLSFDSLSDGEARYYGRISYPLAAG